MIMHLHKDNNITSKYGAGCTLEFSLLFIELFPFEFIVFLQFHVKPMKMQYI